MSNSREYGCILILRNRSQAIPRDHLTLKSSTTAAFHPKASSPLYFSLLYLIFQCLELHQMATWNYEGSWRLYLYCGKVHCLDINLKETKSVILKESGISSPWLWLEGVSWNSYIGNISRVVCYHVDMELEEGDSWSTRTLMP